jgi:phage repressor protein C with HTH and peptisase S24 domain
MRKLFMKTSINSRFTQLINELYKGNKRAFAQAIDVSPTVIENVVGTRQGKPSYDVIDKICANANVSPEWLLTGKGSMLRDSAIAVPKDNQERVAKALPSDEGIPLIPLDAVAGYFSGNSTQVLDYECERYIVPSFIGAEFMIQVRGDSMLPKYSSGDIVACKHLPLDTFFQWNKVYVVDTEQSVLIKRVKQGRDDEHIKLVSDNEQYDPFEIHRSEIVSLAIVIGVIRFE